jgi:hypothetical protein
MKTLPKRWPDNVEQFRIAGLAVWCGEPNAITNAIGYAMHRSRSHDAVFRVYDLAGNVIETHEHAGDFKEW